MLVLLKNGFQTSFTSIPSKPDIQTGHENISNSVFFHPIWLGPFMVFCQNTQRSEKVISVLSVLILHVVWNASSAVTGLILSDPPENPNSKSCWKQKWHNYIQEGYLQFTVPEFVRQFFSFLNSEGLFRVQKLIGAEGRGTHMVTDSNGCAWSPSFWSSLGNLTNNMQKLHWGLFSICLYIFFHAVVTLN